MSDLSDPNDNASRVEEAFTEAAIKNPVVIHRYKFGDRDCRKCKHPNDRYRDGYGTCSDCAEDQSNGL